MGQAANERQGCTRPMFPVKRLFSVPKPALIHTETAESRGKAEGGEGGKGSGTGDRRWLGANLGYLERQLVRTCALGSAGQLLPKLNFVTCILNFVSSTKVNYSIKFKTKNLKKQYKWFVLDVVLLLNYICFALIEFFQCGPESLQAK